MGEVLFLLLGRNVCSVKKLMFNVAERTNGMNCHLKQRAVLKAREEGEKGKLDVGQGEEATSAALIV